MIDFVTQCVEVCSTPGQWHHSTWVQIWGKKNNLKACEELSTTCLWHFRGRRRAQGLENASEQKSHGLKCVPPPCSSRCVSSLALCLTRLTDWRRIQTVCVLKWKTVKLHFMQKCVLRSSAHCIFTQPTRMEKDCKIQSNCRNHKPAILRLVAEVILR